MHADLIPWMQSLSGMRTIGMRQGGKPNMDLLVRMNSNQQGLFKTS